MSPRALLRCAEPSIGLVRLSRDSALERQAQPGHRKGDRQHGDHVESRERQRADRLGETAASSAIATPG